MAGGREVVGGAVLVGGEGWGLGVVGGRWGEWGGGGGVGRGRRDEGRRGAGGRVWETVLVGRRLRGRAPAY